MTGVMANFWQGNEVFVMNFFEFFYAVAVQHLNSDKVGEVRARKILH